LDLYGGETARLVEEGHAYACFCSEKRLELLRKDAARRREKPMYDGKCRDLDKSEVKRRIENGEKCCTRFKVSYSIFNTH
jgi:glutamyl-tRNA synthetase